MSDRPMSSLFVTALTGLALLAPLSSRGLAHGPQQDIARIDQGRGFPIASRDTMRALVHHLDARAQLAAEKAAKRAHHGTRAEQKFLQSIKQFARRTEEFHQRYDRELGDPRLVRGEVRDLQRRAQDVSSRIRHAHVFEQTHDDWDDVLDVLHRMEEVTLGRDVQVPLTDPSWPVYDRLERRR